MKSEFNYKWSKIFAAKRYNGNGTGEITLSLQEQIELLEDGENSLQTVGDVQTKITSPEIALSYFGGFSTVEVTDADGRIHLQWQCRKCKGIMQETSNKAINDHLSICKG